ncbi:MAG: peptidylprolyl isomerase [Anaerolineaceae bacterium]|nr:peptidylprolyl isomerase [Anaerolineaceae bacterium]
MPNQKLSKRAAQKKKNNRDNIQIIAIIVIVLVVAGIAFAVYENIISGQPTAQSQLQPTIQVPQSPTQNPAQNIVQPTAPAAAASSPAAPGQAPKLTGTKTYSSAPPMTIDKTKQYTATVKMAKGGTFVIQLYPDKAPITVNSFVFLANQGYFNGTTFHRVLQGFMAQGGDPTGTGSGGPGYQFVNENSDLKFDKAGVVAMANAGADTNGSQFFITFGPQPSLDGGYTIFGQVTSGMDVVNAITLRDPQTNPTFTGDAIDTITITEK